MDKVIENVRWIGDYLDKDAEYKGIGQGSEGARYCWEAANEIESLRRQIEEIKEGMTYRNSLVGRLEAERNELKAENERLQAVVDQSIDDGINKVMAMSDEQINALAGYEGRSPEDQATIARQCFDIAALRVERDELKRQRDEYKADAERYRGKMIANAERSAHYEKQNKVLLSLNQKLFKALDEVDSDWDGEKFHNYEFIPLMKDTLQAALDESNGVDVNINWQESAAKALAATKEES